MDGPEALAARIRAGAEDAAVDSSVVDPQIVSQDDGPTAELGAAIGAPDSRVTRLHLSGVALWPRAIVDGAVAAMPRLRSLTLRQFSNQNWIKAALARVLNAAAESAAALEELRVDGAAFDRTDGPSPGTGDEWLIALARVCRARRLRVLEVRARDSLDGADANLLADAVRAAAGPALEGLCVTGVVRGTSAPIVAAAVHAAAAGSPRLAELEVGAEALVGAPLSECAALRALTMVGVPQNRALLPAALAAVAEAPALESFVLSTASLDGTVVFPAEPQTFARLSSLGFEGVGMFSGFDPAGLARQVAAARRLRVFWTTSCSASPDNFEALVLAAARANPAGLDAVRVASNSAHPRDGAWKIARAFAVMLDANRALTKIELELPHRSQPSPSLDAALVQAWGLVPPGCTELSLPTTRASAPAVAAAVAALPALRSLEITYTALSGADAEAVRRAVLAHPLMERVRFAAGNLELETEINERLEARGAVLALSAGAVSRVARGTPIEALLRASGDHAIVHGVLSFLNQ